ncbi:MAG: hypothetical protein ACT4PV_16015 [Planctomycetaceae bacterium]
MRGAAAGTLAVALLGASLPLRAGLREAAPPELAASDLALGRLAGSALTGTFRPLLLQYLWLRTEAEYLSGRHEALHALYRTMAALYPTNEGAREFIGHRLAFTMKRDVPDPTAAWAWAEEGLELLWGLLPGHRQARLDLALWFYLQCGENPLAALRYAGPKWEREKELRRRARAWTARRLGRGMERFEAPVALLEGREGYSESLMRARILEQASYEELVRDGGAPSAAAACRELLAMAELFADTEPVAASYRADAALLEALARGEPPAQVATGVAAPVAAALWGMGMAREGPGAARLLELAHELYDPDAFAEERAQVALWLAHRRDPSQPRPPHPFDGLAPR